MRIKKMGMKYSFEIITPSEEDWSLIESCYDSTIYKTRQWFNYLYRQGCKSFIVRVSLQDEKPIGYFVGEKVKRGITLITSPFEGIGTGHQGLSMLNRITPEERLNIYKEFSNWVFKNGYSWFVQVEDWQLSMQNVHENDTYFYEPHRVKYVDLTQSEDALFHSLHKDCKYSLNKAKRNGIIVRETKNVDSFIEIFYSQLEDVFDKKSLHPTHSKDNVKSLIESIWPDKSILLEAVTREGEIAATAIVPIHGEYSATWQTASFRAYQIYRPNEVLRWEAMLRCKKRGATMINFCGTQAWKDKFGAVLTHTPRLIFCKYPVLIKLKKLAKSSYYLSRNKIASFHKLMKKL